MDQIAWTNADARLLGSRIKAIREDQQLTQEQVAYASGLTRAHYALLETGQSSSRQSGTWANPKVSTVAAIASVLGVPMTQLYPFDGEPHEDATTTARIVLARNVNRG